MITDTIKNINIEQVMPFVYLGIFCICAWYAYDLYIRFNRVKRSVGWDFIDSLGKVRTNNKGNDLVLRIKSQAGRETYMPIKHTPIIEYPYKIKGEEVKRYVIYDERAVDYLNGIPILNVTPNDIRPIDRETGLLVNIPSEIIEKLAVDSSKTAENEAKKDKMMKLLIYAIIGLAVLFFIGLSYINQTNSELQVKLSSCILQAGKTAIITAN